MEKVIKTFICGCLFISTSCDNRSDDLYKFNFPPEIGFKIIEGGKEKIVKNFVDSLKITNEDRKNRLINLYFHDEDENIKSLSFVSSSKFGVLSYRDQPISGNQLPLEDPLILSYSSEEEELTKLTFRIEDLFGSTDECTLTVFSFKNLPPIAKFSAIRTENTSELEYTFDGSKSFDQDKNFGGRISEYVFKTGDQELRSNNGVVKHVFSEKGTQKASLMVIDNEGMESNEIIVEFTID